MSNELLDAALRYAALGWRVFPCLPRQKIPATPHGVKDATTNPDQIREWWAKWPNANVAIACGVDSGVHVVDVDVQASSDVSGWNSLAKFAEAGNELPPTIRQDTPRGGAHFFYRTDDPPANRNSFAPGIDIRSTGYYVIAAPSVHPNGGQYVWAQGCAPWEREPAEYPAFMRPTTRAPWASPAPRQMPLAAPSRPADDDVTRRASLYLAECEPAIQGCAGHDKLLWAAGAMTWGCELPDQQAYALLASEYNPHCVPPWNLDDPKDEKDFRRKIAESRRNPPDKPRGWILNDPAYAPLDSFDPSKIDVNSLLAGFTTQAPAVLSAIATPSLPSSELQFLTRPTGLLGELCSWINATAIREQPFLALACSLTFLGSLFGRKIKDQLGSRTNIYCMGVAPSSAGKAHAPNQIRKLCEAAGCLDLIGGDDFASDSAIEARMEKWPTTLFLCDEIGYMLSHIRSGVSQHHAKVVPLLMKLYSSAGNIYKGREYAEAEKQRTIIQPCCCLYGTSTPERFADGISPDELQDGWLSRCLVFMSRATPRKSRNRREVSAPDSICERVAAWYARQIDRPTDAGNVAAFATHRGTTATIAAPEQLIVPTTDEAERIFIAFDDETMEFGRNNAQLACLWAKGEENARRIALILAGSEEFDAPTITPAIADYACRLVRYLLVDFGTNIVPTVATCATDNRKQKLMIIIGEAGIEGCTKSYITRKSQWANGKERAALLADLIEAEEVFVQAKGEGTKKAIYYWTADNFRAYLTQNVRAE